MSIEISEVMNENPEVAADLDQLRWLVLRGMKGDPGFSPEITSSAIPGGHRIDITNELGPDSFNVMDGEDGADGTDGVSPTVTVTEIEGGHRVTITDATGAHPFDVMDGEGGEGGGSANAVLYTQQSLTDAQKAQARTNIGAASMADIGTVFTLKGGVATVADLPQTGNRIGDVWYVENLSAGFIWITSTAYPNGYWEELGETIDMSAYIEKPANPQTGYVITWNGSAWIAQAVPKELPTVAASDNGKFLRVVNGAWAAQAVPAAESNSFGGGA